MKANLQEILYAKDKRAMLKKSFSELGMPSVSLSLNIPGFPKTNKNVSLFFKFVLKELKIYLLANRIIIDEKSEVTQEDASGNYFISSVSSCETNVLGIKNTTEIFEEKHDLGRFIDVDIVDEDGNYVSSNKLKICYFCEEKPAIVCMREKNHSYLELRTFIFDKIGNFLKEKRKKYIIEQLSSIALKSILYEVSLSPKPGLVDFNNSGSHKDMDYYTFLNSSSSLVPFFRKFAEIGYDFQDNFSKALPIIRNIGIQAEQEMFKATNNVNTQKGIIFLMGISLFSASYIFSDKNNFNIVSFQNIVQLICKNLVRNELQNNLDYKTHGEICFKKFGEKGAGVRFEVENAFPTVFSFALPVLENNLIENKKEIIDFSLRKTLLAIISENNDSNILYRKGEEILDKLKILAKRALINDEKFKDICEFCTNENISPGGSADLLAITVFIHFVKDIKNEF